MSELIEESQRCGYVAFLGRPNAGKSTLFNACLKHKIVGVSRRPQTTREAVLGIRTIEQAQILFYDTPGVFGGRDKSSSRFLRHMNKVAQSVVPDCDLAFYLIDGTADFHFADAELLTRLAESHTPLQVVLTKSDRVKNRQVSETQSKISKLIQDLRHKQQAEGRESMLEPEVLVVSAKTPSEVDLFCERLAQKLPKNQWLYDRDDLTDRSEKFILSELIREQLFRVLSKEIPFGSSVEIDEIGDRGADVFVGAVLTVDKLSHKGIVIGRGGTRLRDIGIAARQSLMKYYGKTVHLDLHVMVKDKSKWQETMMESMA